MFHIALRRLVLVVLLTLLASSVGMAAQRPIVSSMKNVRAVMESKGYFITPAYTSGVHTIAGDEAPAQIFEVVRPTDSRVTIGRLFTSCSCVQLEATKTTFERGEPVMLTLRNIKPTPPSGQTYAIYVQLTSPVRTTLRYDTFVQSDRFTISEPVEVASAQATMSDPEYVTLPEELGTTSDLEEELTAAPTVHTEAQDEDLSEGKGNADEPIAVSEESVDDDNPATQTAEERIEKDVESADTKDASPVAQEELESE